MSPYAFVFYATQWRPDLTRPFEVCLHSLDSRGGRAADYPRYLVYSEEITPEIRNFCERYRVTLQYERRFTYRLAWPNKALMCRVPQHDVVCILDLDIVFLRDPTPMFELARSTGKAYSRLDLLVPLHPWPGLPEGWRKLLRDGVGQRIWRGQYHRFSPEGGATSPELPRSGGGTMPPYFNNGVNFVPGSQLRTLGNAWKHISSCFLRDISLHRPYTRFFIHYFLDQISYALALHREQIPWDILPGEYNLIPSAEAAADDLRLIREDRVVMAHMVSPIRHWLAPDTEVDCPEVVQPVYRQVRELVAEMK